MKECHPNAKGYKHEPKTKYPANHPLRKRIKLASNPLRMRIKFRYV